MAEAESAIKARLDGYNALTQLLASTSSIWAVLAPEDTAKPFLTYEVVSEAPTLAMAADCTPTEALVIVNIYADTFLEIVNVYIQLKAALNRYSGSEGSVTVQDTLYEGRNDNFDPTHRDYQRTVNFRMFYEES